MAYQVKEKKKSTPIDQTQNGSKNGAEHYDPKGDRVKGINPSTQIQKKKTKLDDLLITFPNTPLIPCETALSLLRIQSKFVSSHPCLCTSRFRHALHQLDDEHHQDLDRLCSQLAHVLKFEDEKSDGESMYQSVIPYVFGDVNKLELKANEWFERSGQCTKDQPSILCMLNSIVNRLVNEYRAIFAIEVEFSRSFEKSDDELHIIERKRHEETDYCPEEIKSMKVACEELSLECPDTNVTLNNFDDDDDDQPKNIVEKPENNPHKGPKFCLKSLTSQEIPEKDNSIHRHPKDEYNSALEDTRSRHRRSQHHFMSNSRSADDKSNIAINPVIKLPVPANESEPEIETTTTFTENPILPTTPTTEKYTFTLNSIRILQDSENSVNSNTTDSTPISSDAEQNPSPRRTCLRKRKERRDSTGDDQQDHKFCKSSSDVFPSCLQSGLVRKVKSTVEIQNTSNNNQECTTKESLEKSTSEENSVKTTQNAKCIFYLSEDEEAIDCLINNDKQKSKRAIVKPSRRCRVNQPKLEKIICQNDDELDECDENSNSDENSATCSPILPWKKSFDLSPLPMCTPPALSSVPSNLVSSLKSSPTNSTSSEFSESSSSSNDNEDFTVKSEEFSVKSLTEAGGYRQIQPISWEPHGALANSDLLDSEAKSFGLLQHSRSYTDRYIDELQKSKIKKLSKQLGVVRKKIEAFEAHFEDTFGYRPSQAEKQNNKSIRKLMLQHNRIKRQIRLCRESGDSGCWDDYSPPAMSPSRSDSPSCTDFSSILNVYSDNSEMSSDCAFNEGSTTQIENVIKDLEKSLDKDRTESGRPQELNSMSAEQILEEKQSIQRVLNQYQDVLKRSTASEKERHVLRDLLQRYRSVKRLIRRSSNVLIKDPCELETIPEGSEIQLTLASPQHRICIEMNRPRVKDESFVDDLPDTNKNDWNTVETIAETEQNLHALSRNELYNVLKLAKEEKKQLKRSVKEQESKFIEQNGRPMAKTDIKEQEIYGKYKMAKAKLKLVDALLSKKIEK